MTNKKTYWGAKGYQWVNGIIRDLGFSVEFEARGNGAVVIAKTTDWDEVEKAFESLLSEAKTAREKAFFKDCLNRVAIGTTEYARKEQKEADKRKAARQARKANQQQMDFNKVISKVQPEIELIREKEELIKELQKDIAGHAFNISINKYDMNDVQLLSHYSACLKNTLDIINSMIERIENHFKKNAPKEWGLIWCRTLNNFTLSPYTNLPFSIMAKI